MKDKKTDGKAYGHAYYLAHKELYASRAKAWREAHREEEIAKKKAYYSEHKKELNEKARARRNKDGQGYRERGRAFYAANRERIRGEYIKNREKHLAAAKKYALNHKAEIKKREKAYRLSHREELRTKRRAYGLANKEKRRAYRLEHKGRARALHLLKQYGLLEAEFNALLNQQGGQCKICGSKEWKGPAPYVDHDHTTGRVRGILCHNCNVALGLVMENVETLKKMIEYLKGEENERGIGNE